MPVSSSHSDKITQLSGSSNRLGDNVHAEADIQTYCLEEVPEEDSEAAKPHGQCTEEAEIQIRGLGRSLRWAF